MPRLFDYTGHMVEPWSRAGFLCYCVDLQHPPGETIKGNLICVGADVRGIGCLRLLKSKSFSPFLLALMWRQAEHVGSKTKVSDALIRSLQLFDAAVRLAEWTKAPYMIENPVSVVSTHWRKPDHRFDPCDYGGYLTPAADAYTKKTCLWTGNGFTMPKPQPVPPVDGSKMHRLSPSFARANLRSATPKGFAQAVFEANSGLLRNIITRSSRRRFLREGDHQR